MTLRDLIKLAKKYDLGEDVEIVIQADRWTYYSELEAQVDEWPREKKIVLRG